MDHKWLYLNPQQVTPSPYTWDCPGDLDLEAEIAGEPRDCKIHWGILPYPEGVCPPAVMTVGNCPTCHPEYGTTDPSSDCYVAPTDTGSG